jgi:hypothetical protein
VEQQEQWIGLSGGLHHCRLIVSSCAVGSDPIVTQLPATQGGLHLAEHLDDSTELLAQLFDLRRLRSLVISQIPGRGDDLRRKRRLQLDGEHQSFSDRLLRFR